MPKSAALRTQRRKYVPPSIAIPKTVCVLLVRPDGKVLMLQQDDGVYSDPGGRIERGERWDDAAASEECPPDEEKSSAYTREFRGSSRKLTCVGTGPRPRLQEVCGDCWLQQLFGTT